jgi:hypothetical protein
LFLGGLGGQSLTQPGGQNFPVIREEPFSTIWGRPANHGS